MFHRITKHDASDDLIEIEYQCSVYCMDHRLADLKESGENMSNYQYGTYPAGEETDYNVYCSYCNELLWHGLVNADARP